MPLLVAANDNVVNWHWEFRVAGLNILRDDRGK